MPSHNTEKLPEYVLIIPLLRLITNPTAALTHLHETYGDLVLARLFQKKLLFVSNPAYIEEIFSQEAKGAVNRDAFYTAKKPLFGDGLVNSMGDTWTRQRRLMQPFFNKDAIVGWSPLIIDEAEQLVAQWYASQSDAVNISAAMKQLVQNIFIKILFGKQTVVHQKQALLDALGTMTKTMVYHFAARLFGQEKLKHLFLIQNRQLDAAISQFKDFAIHELERSKAHAVDSLIAQLAQARDKKTGYAMTESLLEDEAINLFFAGQDTTVNILIWFLYLIGKDERVQAKIAQEIDAHKNDTINPENLAKLTYTKAALFETLRLFTATSGLTRHPASQASVGGFSFGEDTTLFISIYAAHVDKRYWQRPHEFYPEHFVNPELNAARHRYAFLPFGGGIHNCIGRHLAEMEMMIILVTLLRQFRFTTLNKVNKAISVTLKPDRDVLMKINSKG